MSVQQRPDLNRLIEFQVLLLQLRAVKRVVHLPTKEQENDVDHSYSLAMMAWFIVQYFPELDRDKVIRFALTHDIIEVHAGDTYIYADKATLASKKQREADALEKLRAEWPDFPDLITDIVEYESRRSSEAKFVYALDKIMPIMLIYLGKGYTWQTEGVKLEQLHAAKKDKVAVSPEINDYYNQLYALLSSNTHLFSGSRK